MRGIRARYTMFARKNLTESVRQTSPHAEGHKFAVVQIQQHEYQIRRYEGRVCVGGLGVQDEGEGSVALELAAGMLPLVVWLRICRRRVEKVYGFIAVCDRVSVSRDRGERMGTHVVEAGR